MKNTKHAMAIVGIGDVFERFYFKALRKLKDDGLLEAFDVYCIDDSSIWYPNSIRVRRKKMVFEIQSLGFEFFDKNEPSHENQYKDLVAKRNVHCVIIATPDYSHVGDINEWLEGNCTHIIVEKPLAAHFDDLDKLVGKDTKRIRAFDHYRGKVHTRFRRNSFWNTLRKELGSDIAGFRFFCIEDFSGTHDAYLTSEATDTRIRPGLNGPIEISGRTITLEQGMVFDLMSHMLAVIQYFAEPEHIVVETVKAGKYRGVGFNYGKEAHIPNETFAFVRFTLPSFNGQNIAGEAYVGKGIRGIKNLDTIKIHLAQDRLPESDKEELRNLLEGDVKILEFSGTNGTRVLIFLKRGGKKLKIRPSGRGGRLEDFAIGDPHRFSLEHVISLIKRRPGREINFLADRLTVFLTFDEAVKNMRILKTTQDKIVLSKAVPYFLGYREYRHRNGEILRQPEYLDEILEHFQNNAQ